MCEDQSWGVPTRLYVDNGGEYNWGEFVQDLCKLKRSIEMKDWADLDDNSGMHKAMPYNAPAKVIETIFSIFTRSIEPLMPGYIGGDRLKKKVETEGKPPKPYPGTFEKFVRDYLILSEFYHNKHQKGHLDGMSPNESFRSFIDQGWKSITLDRAQLAVAFSKAKSCRVSSGGRFQFNNMIYTHPSFVLLVGGNVIVRQPLFGDRTELYVYDDDDVPLCTCQPDQPYAFDDTAGAKEQSKRQGSVNRQVAALKAETHPVDLVQAAADYNAMVGPAPTAESDGVIRIRKFQAPTEAATAAPAKPALDKAAIRREMLANLRSA